MALGSSLAILHLRGAAAGGRMKQGVIKGLRSLAILHSRHAGRGNSFFHTQQLAVRREWRVPMMNGRSL